MGQGQPRVLICIILVVLLYTMTHTKFQGNLSIGSEEGDFFNVIIIYGHGGHVGHVTQLICINFHSHSPLSFHMSFGFKSLKCFCEKQVVTLKSECLWPRSKNGFDF